MTQKFINNYSTTVAQTFGSGDTYLRVASPVGLPVLGVGEYFLLTVFRKVGQNESGHEVVKVTSITEDLLTVERAVEGAAASMFLTGDRVEGRLTAKAMHDKADVIVSGTHIKTINGETVVGSGDLVIATDKNLDGGTSSSVFSYADFQIDCGGSI